MVHSKYVMDTTDLSNLIGRTLKTQLYPFFNSKLGRVANEIYCGLRTATQMPTKSWDLSRPPIAMTFLVRARSRNVPTLLEMSPTPPTWYQPTGTLEIHATVPIVPLLHCTPFLSHAPRLALFLAYSLALALFLTLAHFLVFSLHSLPSREHVRIATFPPLVWL